MKLNNEILEKINSFILDGNLDKELEIIITEQNIPLKEILKKYTKIQIIYQENEYCVICKSFMKKGEYKRIINKCNHFCHKKCFDKVIKFSDNLSCQVCDEEILIQ